MINRVASFACMAGATYYAFTSFPLSITFFVGFLYFEMMWQFWMLEKRMDALMNGFLIRKGWESKSTPTSTRPIGVSDFNDRSQRD